MVKSMEFLGLLAICLICVVTGCSGKQEINYSELKAEELEILYRHGKEQLLPNICEAYAKWYLERPEAEWRIEGAEYKKKDGEKFLQYCSKSFKIHGDKLSACYLKSYYQSLVDKEKVYLAEFIFYLKNCGNETNYKAFLEKDSRVTAMADHALTSLKYLAGSKDPTELLKRIKKVSALFRRYVEDLKQVEGDAVLFSGRISDLVIAFDGVANTLETMKILLDQTRVHQKDISAAQSSVEKMLWHVSNLERDVTAFLEVVISVNGALLNPESLNKDLLLHIKDTLDEFKKRRDAWIKDYDSRFDITKG